MLKASEAFQRSEEPPGVTTLIRRALGASQFRLRLLQPQAHARPICAMAAR
jgi:hypothetical protein